MSDRRKIEALAEAVARYSGYTDPTSPLYWARNPLGLRGFSPVHPINERGERIFRSVLDGLQAGLHDVTLKVTGMSRAHLQPDQTLTDLSNAYNAPIATATAWGRFLRQALHDETITARTTLSYFLTNEPALTKET